MYCDKCKKEWSEEHQFCPECGAVCFSRVTEQNAPKSKFDLFMEKVFLANGRISYKQAARGYSIAIVMVQVLSVFLLFTDIDIDISVVNLIFMLLDWYFLSKQGISGVWQIWGLFLIPVYMWIRESKTDKQYVWPIISTVASVLTIFVVMVSLLLLMLMEMG